VNKRIPAEMLCFVIFIYNYPGEPDVAAANWPCAYLFILCCCCFCPVGGKEKVLVYISVIHVHIPIQNYNLARLVFSRPYWVR